MKVLEGTWYNLNDSKACIEYPNDMDDIDDHIEECSPNKKHKVLTVIFAIIWLLACLVTKSSIQ